MRDETLITQAALRCACQALPAPKILLYSAASFFELRSRHEISMSVDMMSPKVR
jgi:hypothetical protein